MDTEKLIELVRDRKEIYDPKDPKHRNKDFIANIWKNIANELQTTDIEAKTKWQNLWSNYMREKRNNNSIPSGSAAMKHKMIWPYYDMMKFLAGSIMHKKTIGSVSDAENGEGSQSLLQDCYIDDDQMNRCPENSSPHLLNETGTIEYNNVSENTHVVKKRKKKYCCRTRRYRYNVFKTFRKNFIDS